MPRTSLALLQRDGVTFQGVASRKRRDRLLQAATLCTLALAASTLTSGGLRAIAPALGDESPAGLGGGLLLAGLALQVSRVWEPGMAPADVLAKTMQPVTDVISAENRGTVEGDGTSQEAGKPASEDDEDEGSGGGGGGGGGEQASKPLPFMGKGGLPLL